MTPYPAPVMVTSPDEVPEVWQDATYARVDGLGRQSGFLTQRGTAAILKASKPPT
ncbi:MAG: hypothetical protein WBE79_09210 [Candidatus Cybelea sp.]